MSGSDGKGSTRAALGGVLAAGSLVLLWAACLAPSGRVGLTAAAGLFPMAATLYAGRTAGFLCWAAASALGLFLLPDKGIAVMFLAFLGLYPVVKSRLESLNRLWMEWCLKLILFGGALTLFRVFLWGFFLPDAPVWPEDRIPLLYLGGCVVFVIYDIGLSRLITLLRIRLNRVKGH